MWWNRSEWSGLDGSISSRLSHSRSVITLYVTDNSAQLDRFWDRNLNVGLDGKILVSVSRLWSRLTSLKITNRADRSSHFAPLIHDYISEYSYMVCVNVMRRSCRAGFWRRAASQWTSSSTWRRMRMPAWSCSGHVASADSSGRSHRRASVITCFIEPGARSSSAATATRASPATAAAAVYDAVTSASMCQWHRGVGSTFHRVWVEPWVEPGSQSYWCIIKPSRWSKNLDERPHRRGRIFRGWQRNVTSTCGEHCSRTVTVIEDWMIPFAVHTATEIPNASQWATQRRPKLPIVVGGSGTPSMVP